MINAVNKLMFVYRCYCDNANFYKKLKYRTVDINIPQRDTKCWLWRSMLHFRVILPKLPNGKIQLLETLFENANFDLFVASENANRQPNWTVFSWPKFSFKFKFANVNGHKHVV